MLNAIAYTLVSQAHFDLSANQASLIPPYRPYFVRFQRTPAGSGLAAIQTHHMASTDPTTETQETVTEQTQFLSTLLLLQGTSEVAAEDKTKLLQKISRWQVRFRGTLAEETSDRCKDMLKSTT